MDTKFRNLVDDIMGLSDSISIVAEELKDGGELSGEVGKQFMDFSAYEIIILKERCSDVLAAFMSMYGKDYVDLCQQYATIGTGEN